MRDYDKNKLNQALSKRANMEKDAFDPTKLQPLLGTVGQGLKTIGDWGGSAIKALGKAGADTLILGPILGAGVGGAANYIMRPSENDRKNLRNKFLIDMYRKKTIDALDRAAEQQGLEDVPDELIMEHLSDAGWSDAAVDKIRSLSNEI